MIPATFEYIRAGSLAQALALLGSHEDAKVIAGGHSLLPVMKFRMAQPGTLIDIARVPELHGIDRHQGDLRIGAATTYRALLQSRLVSEGFPLLHECVEDIGDVQVRNRGTLGGSLAHCDPNSDLPAVMLVLGAKMVCVSAKGTRTVPAAQFFTSAFSSALQDGELLQEIHLPPLPAGAGTCYHTVAQAASGYAMAGAAVVVTKAGGKVTSAKVALTSSGDIGRVVDTSAFVGSDGGDAALAALGAAASALTDATGDLHAPADYRRHLMGVVTRRAAATALSRAK
ncbi:MAG: xanthine dehydrogenase family protein subunit M [Gemmatimonadales bacterium]|nr:xanthine dehydrogenase family protein subunit M [Gemmatimonadales bacterium]